MRRLFIAFVVLMALCFISVPNVFAGEQLVWPVKGGVIKKYAPDEHRGIDISANVGDPVVAAQDGIVYWTGNAPNGGPCISIDHAVGLTSTYLPVQPSVQKGQIVKAGEIIGRISSEVDKSSDIPHLHLGVFYTASRDNKNYLNPCDLLANLGMQVEDKGTQETAEKSAQAMLPIEMPKSSAAAIAPVASIQHVEKSGKPDIEEPKSPRVERPRPRIERPIAPVAPIAAPKITQVSTSFGLPLRVRDKEPNLNHLALAVENDLIIDLDKPSGRVVDSTKSPQYLQMGLPHTRLMLGVGSIIISLAVLYFCIRRIRVASRKNLLETDHVTSHKIYSKSLSNADGC